MEEPDMNTLLLSRSDRSGRADSRWKKRSMNGRAVAPIAAALLSSLLLSSTASALTPEKQTIYSNTPGGLLCGTHTPPSPPSPCTVPDRQRLIIEQVSGYAFVPASANTTLAVSLVVTDAELGLTEAAFHTFLATKTNTSGGTDVFTFAIPFKVMLHAGASFYFSPSANVAVSGYLVKE
jgi:hypothetical protein